MKKVGKSSRESVNAASDLKNQIRARVAAVEARVSDALKKAGRSRDSLLVLPITKTWSAEVVGIAAEVGFRSFGENYVQEALEKMDSLAEMNSLEFRNLDWHFVGHIQSNKIKSILGRFSLIHSVDRIKILEEFSRRIAAAADDADSRERPSFSQKVLIEINVAEESSKSGIAIDDLPRFLDEAQALPNIQIRGLMCMPPLGLSSDKAQRFFERIRNERDRHAARLSDSHSLVELSMGTSHDYCEAIASGATIVRLGTVLFGEREK